MKFITPRESPYRFWNHVWGLTLFADNPYIPSIQGVPFARDLIWLIADRRNIDDWDSAARTARLMVARWEPQLLPNEAQSRPQYVTLEDIWQAAVLNSLNQDITFYLEDEAFLDEMERLGGYRFPEAVVIRSIVGADAVERLTLAQFWEHLSNFEGAGSTTLIVLNEGDFRGKPFELGAWLIWESKLRLNTSHLSAFPVIKDTT